jgi:hypothetical protein
VFAQIIYMSNLVGCDESQIPAILRSARKNNSAKGITGMLLYGNCGFVQVLEGQLHAVRASFNTIRADNRKQSANTC